MEPSKSEKQKRSLGKVRVPVPFSFKKKKNAAILIMSKVVGEIKGYAMVRMAYNIRSRLVEGRVSIMPSTGSKTCPFQLNGSGFGFGTVLVLSGSS